ncbi:tyrosine-protein phosphatase [Kitasatospora sp. NPDC050543]|uniref:tyrosine-protein phosphatase n=1 Tax=Kitasatospora sp. NPDC050543 TaxID=3364054 RepID=UPI00378A9567
MTDREPDAAPADDAASAFIDIPGVRNFRDAGGIGALRPGRLYRSGSLHHLTPEGAQRLKALGVRSVIDLRSPAELETRPDLHHGLDPVALNLPTFPADRTGGDHPWPEEQAELYPFMAEHGGPSIAATVRHLATPGALPALVHCAVGKDRTGLTIAVIQSLLGASATEITADYLHSNAGLGLLAGPTPYIDESGAERTSRPVTAALLHSSLHWIHTHHTSIPAYLRFHGVTDPELAALRESLTGE